MATNGEDGPSFFARYIDNPSEQPRPEIIRLGRDTEKLLDWLVHHWANPTIRAHEIHVYGPNCVRNRKTILNLAKILVEQGWLIPLKGRRRDMHEWQIVPKTSRQVFLQLIHQQ
jgi:hypothetical protein